MKYLKHLLPVALVFAAVLMCLSRSFDATDHPDASPPPPDFPLIEQPDDITCGPTSGAMILQHHGKDVTVDQVAEVARTKWFTWNGENIGMTAPDMLAASVKHYGVPCKVMRCRMDNLKHFISTGRYPAVLVRSGNYTWHFVVAIGYDEGKVFVADPSYGGRRDMPNDSFEKSWSFTHDMNGNPCGLTCPVCRGTDRNFQVFPCRFCNRGRIDPVRGLLHSAEVYDHTVVVPDKKRD